jgi:hypothetical protein
VINFFKKGQSSLGDKITDELCEAVVTKQWSPQDCIRATFAQRTE